MAFNPMTIMNFAPQIALLAGELTGKKEEARRLAGILGITGQITEALKSPSIGDVTKKDPLSFNEALTINKDGGISGIDYEKFNFDKALSDKGMKAFSTDIKNSADIFNWKTDTPKLGLGIKEYDDYFANSKFDPWN